jgi:polysaccharide biosynthesis protein PslG
VRPLAFLLLVIPVLALVVPAPASAAKRKVPFGFFGVVVPVSMYTRAVVPDATLDQQMALMARSGVETVRVGPDWRLLEPAQGNFVFGTLDRLVLTAARYRLDTLVNVTGTPQWISDNPTDPDYWRYAPRDPRPFGELMRRLVQRYGPRGTLWTENPGAPRVPVRHWQIWNEQNAPWYWERQPWAPSYTALLKNAFQAIRSQDSGAKIMAGSVVASRSDYPPWLAIRDLYRAGGRRYFDSVSVHPFTNDAASVSNTVFRTLEIVRRMRQQMSRYGDTRKPIDLTEMMWSAAAGKIPSNALLGFETTAKGQAQRLIAVYRALASQRSKLAIGRVYWYTWASEYDTNESPTTMTFRYTGLTRWTGSGPFSPLPVLDAYAQVAAQHEGCRKGRDSRTCR